MSNFLEIDERVILYCHMSSFTFVNQSKKKRMKREENKQKTMLKTTIKTQIMKQKTLNFFFCFLTLIPMNVVYECKEDHLPADYPFIYALHLDIITVQYFMCLYAFQFGIQRIQMH